MATQIVMSKVPGYGSRRQELVDMLGLKPEEVHK